MKEEKKKSGISLEIPIGQSKRPCSPFRKETFDATQKKRDNYSREQTKNSQYASVTQLSSKQTFGSLFVEVKQTAKSDKISISNETPNASFLSNKVEKESFQGQKEYKKKLKRVGKKMWVPAYKQSIQKEEQQEFPVKSGVSSNYLSPESIFDSDDFSDFKEYSRASCNSYNVSEMSRVVQKQPEITYEIPPVITINGVTQKENMIQQNKEKQDSINNFETVIKISDKDSVVEALSKDEKNFELVNSQNQIKQFSSSSSLAIQDGILKDIDENKVTDNQGEYQNQGQYQFDDIEKMLEQIQKNHPAKSPSKQIKQSQNEKKLKIKMSRGEQVIREQKIQQKQKSQSIEAILEIQNKYDYFLSKKTRNSKDLRSYRNSKDLKNARQSQDLRNSRNLKDQKFLLIKKPLEKRTSLIKKHIVKDTIKKVIAQPMWKRESISQYHGYHGESSGNSMKKSNKKLGPLQKQNRQVSLEVQNINKENMVAKKPQNSLSLHSSISDSKIFMNQIKLKDSYNKQSLTNVSNGYKLPSASVHGNTNVNGSPNKFIINGNTNSNSSPSLYSSVKKNGKQPPKGFKDENQRMVHSLKKNYKGLEVNQYILQARKHVKNGHEIVF